MPEEIDLTCSYCSKPISVELKELNATFFVSVRCPHCNEVCPVDYDEERDEYKLLREDDL
jgi:phage FluMu protein Com